MSTGTHTVTAAEVAAIVRERFPWLRGEAVLLGEGLDHRAFEIDGHVIRFPGSEEVAEGLEREVDLTAWLAGRVPLAIPVYTLTGGRVFAGYRKLAGTTAILMGRIEPALVGRGLGEFLRALHAVDPAVAEGFGLEVDDDPGEWIAEALEDLEHAAKYIASETCAAVRRLLAAGPALSSARCVLHGDFAAEHVLLGPGGEPTGVIDWSDARLGDPAVDLAGLFHWGDEGLLSAALASYGPIDGETGSRAVWYAVCRGLGDFAFGDRHGRPEYIAAGMRALSFCVELTR